MPFLHSLVKTQDNGSKGWYAPAELGEDAPHYISFVVPVDETGNFFNQYTCETITAKKRTKRIDLHELVKAGKDSFVLRLGGNEIWFTVRPVPKEECRLPYLGKLKHEDFLYSFTEIEPEEPAQLDTIYDEEGTFVIGCEAFSHYGGIKKLGSKPADSRTSLGKER